MNESTDTSGIIEFSNLNTDANEFVIGVEFWNVYLLFSCFAWLKRTLVVLTFDFCFKFQERVDSNAKNFWTLEVDEFLVGHAQFLTRQI